MKENQGYPCSYSRSPAVFTPTAPNQTPVAADTDAAIFVSRDLNALRWFAQLEQSASDKKEERRSAVSARKHGFDPVSNRRARILHEHGF